MKEARKQIRIYAAFDILRRLRTSGSGSDSLAELVEANLEKLL